MNNQNNTEPKNKPTVSLKPTVGSVPNFRWFWFSGYRTEKPKPTDDITRALVTPATNVLL